MTQIQAGRAQLQSGALSLERLGDLTTYVGEASALGVPAGYDAVELIETDLGNGCPFVLVHEDDAVAVYRQVGGLIDLHILND
jgi:hypothetical protein